MSSFIARSAIRAAPRRQFSLLTTMRNAARTFEPHPFQRMSAHGSAKPDYGKMLKARMVTAGMFAPLALGILGWPVAARVMVDGTLQ